MSDKKGSVLSEMVKYGLVGAVSTVIDIILLNIGKKYLLLPLWLAIALGFGGGTINGYYMNSRWTFHYNTEGQEGRKFSQFATVSIIGLLLTEFIVNAYVAWFNSGFAFMGRDISSYNAGKLIAVVIVFFWNFSANKIWTFNTTNGQQPVEQAGKEVKLVKQ